MAHTSSCMYAHRFRIGGGRPRGATTWESNVAATLVLLQRLVSFVLALWGIGQELRQIDTLFLGFSREVFPDATLDRSRQEDLCTRRDVMETSDSFAEVDLCRHRFIFRWSVTHNMLTQDRGCLDLVPFELKLPVIQSRIPIIESRSQTIYNPQAANAIPAILREKILPAKLREFPEPQRNLVLEGCGSSLRRRQARLGSSGGDKWKRIATFRT